MKKHFILLLVAGLFAMTSCSSDDDADTAEATIVGTWEVTAIESIAPVDPNQCEGQVSTITFKQDNTLDSTFYFQQNDCVADTAEGTWENQGDGNYVMDFGGDLGELEGEVEFLSPDRFTFSTLITVEGVQIPAVFTLERQ